MTPSGLTPLGPDWSIEMVDEIGSTNDELLERFRLGRCRDGVVLVSRHQTTGRGRRDRSWTSPSGRNLLMSVAFDRPGNDPSLYVRALGVAAARAARSCGPPGIEPALKWPNDVVVGELKLAGVLAQVSATGAVVAGIGLNATWAPPGAAVLRPDLDEPVPASRFVDRLRDAVLDELSALVGRRGEPEEWMRDRVQDAYRPLLATIGRRVRVQLVGRDDVIGDAVDVEGGLLAVRDDTGTRHLVDSGDVVHLRPAND